MVEHTLLIVVVVVIVAENLRVVCSVTLRHHLTTAFHLMIVLAWSHLLRGQFLVESSSLSLSALRVKHRTARSRIITDCVIVTMVGRSSRSCRSSRFGRRIGLSWSSHMIIFSRVARSSRS